MPNDSEIIDHNGLIGYKYVSPFKDSPTDYIVKLQIPSDAIVHRDPHTREGFYSDRVEVLSIENNHGLSAYHCNNFFDNHFYLGGQVNEYWVGQKIVIDHEKYPTSGIYFFLDKKRALEYKRAMKSEFGKLICSAASALNRLIVLSKQYQETKTAKRSENPKQM